jgi:hypothetical protein
LTHDSASISLARVSEIDLESRILLSLFLDPLRTVLAVKDSLGRAYRRALDGSGPF